VDENTQSLSGRLERQMKKFIKRGNKRDAAWLAFIMFAVGVFFMGFHSDLGFRIAGGVGIGAGFLAFFKKVKVR
jgi:hypothetical protein